jgi:hypothetical protein
VTTGASKKASERTPVDGTSGGTPLRRARRGQKVTLYLPDKLVEKLRQFSETQRRSMSDAVSAALEKYLGGDKG